MDKLYINGKFYNGKSNKKITAISTKNGKIDFVGLTKDIDQSKYKDIVDFDNQPIYPGFCDTHLHLISYCEKKYYEVDLSDAASLEDLSSKVRDFIIEKNIKVGDWVIGSGWNHENFENKALPDKYLLDQISSQHPILLNRACYHICVVNSLALEKADINEETSNPSGGSIDRIKGNEPSGILRENGVMLVINIMPTLNDKKQLKDMILKGCYALAQVGITRVHTDDFAHVENKKLLFEAFRELAQAGELPINIVLQLRVSTLKDIEEYKELGLSSWTKHGSLVIGPVKIIADGSLGSRTAALEEAYEKSDNRGILLIEPDKLDQLVEKTLSSGFDIAVHAIGDRTMNLILDLYEKYIDLIRVNEFRPSIIHCQIGSKDILKRFKDLNIIANIQPVFLNTDWNMVEDRIGKERLNYSYCWKSYMDKGITCVGSSDAPIESFNPLFGIHCAVARKDLENRPINGWMTKEAISIDQGIKLFTQYAAYASKEESLKGSFELGKHADFVVLSEDLHDIKADEIKNVGVKEVYVKGEKIV